MRAPTILFREGDEPHEERAAPEYFRDLNLDQVVDAAIAGRKEYDLAPLFHACLVDRDGVVYRQDVMRDLEADEVRRIVDEFAAHMRAVRRRLGDTEKLHYRYEREGWLLAAARQYCDAVEGLSAALERINLRSRGMQSFRAWLAEHVSSTEFGGLVSETRRVAAGLAAIRYCLHIHGDTIVVRPFANEVNDAEEIQKTFEKFRRAAAQEWDFKLRDWPGMNHIEAQVLEHVAQLNPETFAALDEFSTRHAEFVEPALATFERESQFYVAWLDLVGSLRREGLPFCYPELSSSRKEETVRETFDIGLARNLVAERRAVVRNDFDLRGAERIFVVSGPNQGGKTTFARTFGQLHHLASIGCTVPGTHARLFLQDRILSHFEREEDVTNLRGKLHDDLVRMRDLLHRATSRSVIILNEIFSSTTLSDASFLARSLLTRISSLDALCVCVTFLGELATLDEKTVSLVSGIDAANPVVRTFKLERRPDDGLAYALAIAEQHRVTYRWLKERIHA